MKDPGSIPILLYHSITDREAGKFSSFTLSPATFEAHLDLIMRRGHTVLSVSDLVEHIDSGGPLPERPVVITFDDGFLDLAEHAWPALAERRLPATAYVTTGFLDRPDQPRRPEHWGGLPLLDATALVDLDRAGLEIGAHSVSHPQLDCISPSAATAQVRDSKAALEALLRHPVDSFAYPFGHFDESVRQAVVGAGFTSACGVKNCLSSLTDDRFALARLTVRNDWDSELLGRVLDGWRVRTAPKREPVRTRMYRVARRARGGHQTGVA